MVYKKIFKVKQKGKAMREILFRGKQANIQEWVEGCLIHTLKYCCILQDEENVHPMDYPYLDNDTGCFDGHATPVMPETVGQYTGLTDKNGKKIFEGDIVGFAKNIYQIIFSVGSFALYDEQGEMISKIGGHNDHCYSFMDLYIECCWEDGWAYDIEVIGNIHDNPELLKGGETNGK